MNSIGHAAGILIFGFLLIVLLQDKRLRTAKNGLLPAFAALLAVIWNGGSLLAMAGSASGDWSTLVPSAVSFAAFSLLPAALFSIALGGRAPGAQQLGWILSGTAVLMHTIEAFTGDQRFHRTGLLLVTIGFALLPIIAGFRLRQQRRPLAQVLIPMALVLYAISFVHFGDSHAGHPWTEELAIHHAGIPLALYIVLQDYRFLLLDAFLRTLASGLLAGAFTLALIWANTRWGLVEAALTNSLHAGIAIVGFCFLLVTFAWLRSALQQWLTLRIFRRPLITESVDQLLRFVPPYQDERELLSNATGVLADYIGAIRYEIADTSVGNMSGLPDRATDLNRRSYGSWVEAVVPLHFARGDCKVILLGSRVEGRRYLSEDLRELSRLSSTIVNLVERFRSEATERLASEASFRALQSQINPHFLFNSLNALYGVIPRSAEGARRTVLNLSEIFRFILQNERASISLSEELKIIRAYLEIEQLRLGDRLRTEVDVDENALTLSIPPLSIQPVVENAVKHGVSRRTGPGYVVLRVRYVEDVVRVEVRDSGGGLLPSDGLGSGVGLDNVRQRLRLMYGDAARLTVEAADSETLVLIEIPSGIRSETPARSQAVVVR